MTRRKYILPGWLLFLFCSLFSEAQTLKPPAPADPRQAARPLPGAVHEKKKGIVAVLQKQQEDWNTGRMQAFLSAYWRSDTLRLVTNRGVVYGWDKLQAQYRRNFPDTTAMGKLDFDVIHIELIGETDAMVTGKFLHKADKKFRAGYFTFLLRRQKNRWVIVADHTST